jgi:hypothetical protein
MIETVQSGAVLESMCRSIRIVMPALVAGIHALKYAKASKAWMRGTRPCMTVLIERDLL